MIGKVNPVLKRLILITILFLCIPITGLSQNKRLIDSLQKQLRLHTALKSNSESASSIKKDTVVINILTALSKAYWSSDLDTAMEYANRCLALSQKMGYKKGISKAYSCMGVICWYKGDNSQSIEFHTKALRIQQEIGDKKGFANTYNNIGLVYDNQGMYPEALNNYISALKTREEIGDREGIANSYNNIGNILFDQHNYSESLKYYSDCLKIRQEMNDERGIANSFNNIANVYFEQGNFVESLKQHLASLSIRKEIGDLSGIAISNSNLGSVYQQIGNGTEALKHFQIALKLDEELGNKTGVSEDHIKIGKLLLLQKKRKEAKKHLDTGLSIATEIGSLESLKEGYQSLSDLYKEEKNYGKSLESYKNYILYRDSVVNIENSRKLIQQQMQYGFDKKEAIQKVEQEKKDKLKETELLSQQKEKQLYIVLGVFLLFMVLALWSRLNYTRKTNKLLEEKNEQIRLEKEFSEQQRIRAELLDMRNKIARDLHDDIGSSLSSISIYSKVAQKITAETAPEAHEILNSVGEIAQEAMENMSDIVWTINPVKDKLDDILQRMRILCEHLKKVRKLNVHFDFSESIAGLSLTMQQRKNIYLIFKEAINNVAKYSEAENCFVVIEQKQDRLSLHVKDDGIGFDNKNDGLGGNGLLNMKSRAKEIDGTIELFSERGKGTELKFSFKL